MILSNKLCRSIYILFFLKYNFFVCLCLQKILNQLPKVKHIIYMDSPKKPDLEGFPDSVELHSYSTIEKLGQEPQNIKGIKY